MPHLVTSVGMTTAARQAIPVAPLGGSFIRGSKDGARLVGSGSSHPQPITSDINSTRLDYKDRCLSSRLGCPASRVPDRGNSQ